ncbi:MAG: hypothetical protein ACLQG3_12545 [Terracidiphilus sp.]
MNARFHRVFSPRIVQPLLAVAALTVFSAGPGSSRANAQTAAGGVPLYPVGGVSVTLPVPPGTGMVELGDDRTKYMAVPSIDRLVAAFIPEKDVSALRSRGMGGINPFAKVAVASAAETVDYNASDFTNLVDSVSKQIGPVADHLAKESEDAFNERMHAMNPNTQSSYVKPVMLGTLFSKTDAYGWGLIGPVTVNGATTTMVVGTVFLRVRKRVFFANFFEAYKDDQTPVHVRAVCEQWADAILAANR